MSKGPQTVAESEALADRMAYSELDRLRAEKEELRQISSGLHHENAALRKRVEALEEALKAWLHIVSNDELDLDDILDRLPDSHVFELVWSCDAPSRKGEHVITAGQIRRAARTLGGDDDKADV